MDFLSSMRISSSGMTANRRRMNTISSNIANVNTTRTPEGGPYRRKDVVLEAIPDAKSFGEILDTNQKKLNRVQVTDIAVDQTAPRLVYDPNHIDANEQGYVAYPNINLMEEMAGMIQATRAYEANASALGASKNMAMTALEIGR
ncbi:MAG: flagellar basal body rod protein FlgC [Bdellovibrionota bacterium]|nr:flagellar basal body rod protein FlgC [Pseudobdellovibrionaceae bacterium]MEC9282146.1 flagellar basal body rod protein FlgC [Bdellovibrionota bacterium]|tara:strand:+ start:161530 stop:161964 length:435 start_codon:yes stop_codon:yes gene_type:complete